MLLTRLLGFAEPAAPPLDLDGLATLALPRSFHREESRELQLPAPRRLLRRPYRELLTPPDQLTYYLPSHDYRHVGGREIPALLRVTLYADDVALAEAPDHAYFHAIASQSFHYDGQQEAIYAQAAPAGNGLYYTEQQQTRPGWFSMKEYRQMHLILTDPALKIRLFLSISEEELSRVQAEQLLRAALHSLVRQPEALTRYFGYVRHFLQHQPALEQANAAANLRSFNEQLTGAGLPPLVAGERYQSGNFVDVGEFFYGINSRQEIFFAARLGSCTQAYTQPEPYFSNKNPDGHYLLTEDKRAILEQQVPAGQLLLVRSSVSEDLRFPPPEFAYFQLADLLRETATSVAQVQRNPGFAPTPRTAPAHWLLGPTTGLRTLAQAGTPTSYQHQAVRFPDNVSPLNFTVRYLGTRTLALLPPEAIFTLTSADGTRYYAVDATQGGHWDVAVGEARYRVWVEPPAQGHLTIERQPVE